MDEEELPAKEFLSEISLPEEIKTDIIADVNEGEHISLLVPGKSHVLLTWEDDSLVAKKPVSYHSKTDGTEFKFDIHQESAGTQRLLELLPAFLNLMSGSQPKVYVIDEINNSLHPQLTTHLLKAFLSHCSASNRAQLLPTTHDLLIMDQRWLRCDEMWVAEREDSNMSHLISLSEYRDID